MKRAASSMHRARAAALAAGVLLAATAWAQSAGTATGAGVVTGPGVSSNAARAAAAAGATAAPAPAPGNPGPNQGAGTASGARFVEACQQALERGQVNPGCQGPLYASEIERLKQDALRTNDPNLLTLLGDAYQSNRTGISDIGQAYRWYLLGAVRGDPRAMQRLSEMYRSGRGAPQDNVKALGYARLAQKLAPPGSASARQATRAIESLGRDLAAEEAVLAERFASELEGGLRGAGPAPTPAAPEAPAPAGPLRNGLPGLGAVRSAVVPVAPADTTVPLTAPAGGPTGAPPLGGLPGTPPNAPQPTQHSDPAAPAEPSSEPTAEPQPPR